MKYPLLAFALLATPATAQDLQQKIEAQLAQAATGTRFGLVVADDSGREIVAINPDGRFIPASNTKIFTTAAAYATLPDIDRPDAAGGAAVRLEGDDVVLVGNGDARLSSAPDCVNDCLQTLADAVVAKTRRVRNVIGDDTRFPDQRWSPGMSWNNIPSRSGTGVSALTLDDNEAVVRVVPSSDGKTSIKLEGYGYYAAVHQIVYQKGATDIGYDRDLGGRTLRLVGSIAPGAPPLTLRIGIDDPAHYAAWRLVTLLRERGVEVTGGAMARHRPLGPQDDPAQRKGMAPRPTPPPALAALVPAPLAEDIRTINKASQNLHAELLLRRVGSLAGSGSIAEGVAQVEAMLGKAGVPRTAWDFSDGSGMSSYNRISPRGTVTLLRWIAAQPWGAAWRATLPVGGTDGTLSRRFKGTPLEGRIFAKTGTLNATNALSGYLIAKSGKTLTFAMLANDIPADAGATRFMDAALLAVAEGS
jgi:serine-type D-Ala-D-Ala carboxypeptidase/endopeptidase (penicillin-binding protein 4)